jgi:cathepsin F
VVFYHVKFLVSTGPLSVLMNAETLSYYKSGIYSPQFCDPESLDHAVLLVGYGSENGVDYWRVKNSWGSSWGEEGYFRIIRGEGKCGINTAVTTGYVA